MKTSPIVIRFSPEERPALQADADKAGISLSALIRNRAIKPWGIADQPVFQSEPKPEKRNTPSQKLPPLKPRENSSNRDYSGAYTSAPSTPSTPAPIKVNPDAYTS